MEIDGDYQLLDERFRGLPGIAVGEKTVYETEDLPEADRIHRIVGVPADDGERRDGDGIELIRIDPADAFIKLQGRFLDPGFTTRQDVTAAAKGYSIFVREITGYGEAPTVDDNINRRFRSIKDQIEQLQHDIQFYERFRVDLTDDESQQFRTVQGQLEQLDQQLDVLRTTSADRPPPAAADNENRGSDAAKPSGGGVLERLKHMHILGGADRHHASPSAPSSDRRNSATVAVDNNTGGDDNILFDGNADFARSVVNLSVRVRQVEEALGGEQQIKQWSASQSASNSSAAAASDGGSILGAVTMLKNQMSLLDAENIDSLDHRLKTFIDRVEQASRKRQTLADDTVKRVNVVYDKLKTIDQASYTVPGALERLTTLSNSLKQSQNFSTDLDEMSRAQDELLQRFAATKELVDSMKQEFPKRAAAIDAKLEELDSTNRGSK